MKWIAVKTTKQGWRRDMLMHRGLSVCSVDTFSHAAYGNVLGFRTGAMACRRKAKKHSRRHYVRLAGLVGGFERLHVLVASDDQSDLTVAMARDPWWSMVSVCA